MQIPFARKLDVDVLGQPRCELLAFARRPPLGRSHAKVSMQHLFGPV